MAIGPWSALHDARSCPRRGPRPATASPPPRAPSGSPRRWPGGTATVTRAVAGATARQAAETAGHGAVRVASRAAQAVPRRYASALGSLADVGPQRTTRRVWSRRGRAHIEVKGLDGHGEQHRRIADDVTAALSRLEGVHWAKVNAVTRQVLLAFDEESTGLERVLAAVEAVEQAHGTADRGFCDGSHAGAGPPRRGRRLHAGASRGRRAGCGHGRGAGHGRGGARRGGGERAAAGVAAAACGARPAVARRHVSAAAARARGAAGQRPPLPGPPRRSSSA